MLEVGGRRCSLICQSVGQEEWGRQARNLYTEQKSIRSCADDEKDKNRLTGRLRRSLMSSYFLSQDVFTLVRDRTEKQLSLRSKWSGKTNMVGSFRQMQIANCRPKFFFPRASVMIFATSKASEWVPREQDDQECEASSDRISFKANNLLTLSAAQDQGNSRSFSPPGPCFSAFRDGNTWRPSLQSSVE